MKKISKKTLSLDLQTIRALDHNDRLNRVVGGSGYCATAGVGCSITCMGCPTQIDTECSCPPGWAGGGGGTHQLQ